MNTEQNFIHVPSAIWEESLTTGCSEPLEKLLNKEGGIPNTEPPGFSYPRYHRICDLWLAGCCYRLCRAVSQDGETLYLFEIKKGGLSLGVPYILQGRKLEAWIEQEDEARIEEEESDELWEERPREYPMLDANELLEYREQATALVMAGNPPSQTDKPPSRVFYMGPGSSAEP